MRSLCVARLMVSLAPFVAGTLTVLLCAVIARRLGAARVARLAAGMSAACLLVVIRVAATRSDPVCDAICTAYDVGLLTWWQALLAGCLC